MHNQYCNNNFKNYPDGMYFTIAKYLLILVRDLKNQRAITHSAILYHLVKLVKSIRSLFPEDTELVNKLKFMNILSTIVSLFGIIVI